MMPSLDGKLHELLIGLINKIHKSLLQSFHPSLAISLGHLHELLIRLINKIHKSLLQSFHPALAISLGRSTRRKWSLLH